MIGMLPSGLELQLIQQEQQKRRAFSDWVTAIAAQHHGRNLSNVPGQSDVPSMDTPGQRPWSESTMGQQTGAPPIVHALTSWGIAAPWLPRSVYVPLARQGVLPDSDLGMQVIKHSPVFNQPRGPRHDPSNLSPTPQELLTPGGTGTGAQFQREGLVGASLPDFKGALGSVLHGADVGLQAFGRDVVPPLQEAARVGGAALQSGAEAVGTLGARIAGPLSHPAETLQQAKTGAAQLQGPAPVAAGAGTTLQSSGGYQPPTGSPFDPGQLTLVQALRGKDLGQGWFPAGEAAKAAREQQAKSRGTIAGHVATFGRLLAADIVEPGTQPYNYLSGAVDGIISWKLDPAAIALTKLGDVRAAKQIFDTTGLYTNGVRKLFHGPTVDAFLDSNPATKLYENIAGTGSITELMRRTKGQWPARVYADLVDAKTPDAVKAILRDEFGKSIRDVPKWGYNIRPSMSNIRLANDMPKGRLDSQNIDNALEQTRRLLVTAKADPAQIDKVLYKVARAEGSGARLYDAVVHDGGNLMANTLNDEFHAGQVAERNARKVAQRDVLTQRQVADEARAQALDLGRTPAQAEIAAQRAQTQFVSDAATRARDNEIRRLVRFFPDSTAKDQQYWVDTMGRAPYLPGVTLNGDAIPIVGPHLPSELLNSSIPLPDVRELRKAASTWRRWAESGALHDTPGVRQTVGLGVHGAMTTGHFTHLLADAFTSTIFKPWAIIRGALPVRVVGEEQVRMATSGLDSTFRHPLSYIAHVIGRKSNTDAYEVPFDQLGSMGDGAFHEALSMPRAWRRFGPETQADLDKIYSRHFTPLPNTDPQFPRAWADEISHLHLDETSRKTALSARDGNGLKAAKDWFKTSQVRQDMIDSGGWRGLVGQDTAADSYIDSVWQRIQQTTNNHSDLIAAIADGSNMRSGMQLNKNFVKRLEGLTNAGLAPAEVKGRIGVTVRHGASEELAATYNRVVDAAFSGLMAKPTNRLSRAPAFKQFYWQRMSEQFGLLDPRSQEQVLRAAEGAGVRKDLFKTMSKISQTGDLGLEDADTIAKAFGLHSTKKLLYDVTERSHFFDAMRIVFPFGEAWKEVFSVWSKLAVQRPQTLRRTQQIIQGARGAHIPGTPAEHGFFFKGQDGREHFVYPFSQAVNKFVTGLPFPFMGDPQSLNIAGQGMPGVGPAVQITADAALPDNATFDGVRHALMPYGSADVGSGALEAFFPGWVQKLRTEGGIAIPGTDWKLPFFHPSAQQARLYSNTVKQAMAYLYSTGAYSMNDRSGMQQMQIDAKHMADKLYTVRSFAQFVAPAAPQVLPKLNAKNGQLAELFVLANDFHAMEQTDFNNAIPNFIDKYGQKAFLATQSFSQQEVYNPPVTKQKKWWESDNAKFVSTYRTVAGFFGPSGGTHDYAAYLRAMDNGLIQTLSPDEWMNAANHRIASTIYAKARQGLDANPTQEQLDRLSNLNTALKKQYPGYDPQGDHGKKFSPERAMIDLQQAANDPAVKAQPVAKAIRQYFDARQLILDELKQSGIKTLNGKNVEPARALLRNLGAALYDKEVKFRPIWDYLLGNEVRPQQTEATVAP